MIGFFNWFVKITAYPVQKLIFRTKVYYEDKKTQSKRVKGSAIIVSNHTSVYDYAVFMFVFFGRTLRYQMAEVLFEKKGLGFFLKRLGGIKVDRNAFSLSHIEKSKEILDKGGVVGVFPEGRLPRGFEEKPLPFKSGATYLALYAGVPVIPVYTNGAYFHGKRSEVMIGKPIDVSSLYDENASERENITAITEKLRTEVIRLGELLDEKRREKRKEKK